MSNRPPLGPNARRTLPVLAAIALVRAAATVVFAAVLGTAAAILARFTYTRFFENATYASDYDRQQAEFAGYGQAQMAGLFPDAEHLTHPTNLLMIGTAALLIKAACDWAATAYAARAAAGAKASIRERLLTRVLATGAQDTPGGAAATSVLLARGLNALDNYYTKTLTALVATAVVPVTVWLVVLWHDRVSALVIALTLPLIPLFMVLIGKTTREDTAQAQADLHRLSDNILELAKGLPVLIGLGRAGAQRQALTELGIRYRQRTMHTLRSAFLSSLALELITTISVAIVAVFIGVRLVNGTMSLDIALMVLLLAPECYQPLRDVGTAYHQSEEGVTALRRAEEIINQPLPAQTTRGTSDRLVVDGLTITYPGRAQTIGPVSFSAAPGTLTAITGESGSGKTTLLSAIAGLLTDGLLMGGEDAPVQLRGHLTATGGTVLVPQTPNFLASTAAGEVALYAGQPAAEVLVADRTDSSLALPYLRAVGLLEWAEVAPESLSMGQQRRLAMARALTRVDALQSSSESGVVTVLVDEPTAHLDEAAAGLVNAALAQLVQPNSVVVMVTHDDHLAAHAHQRVHCGKDGQWQVVENSATSEFTAERLQADAKGVVPSLVADDARAPQPSTSQAGGSVTCESARSEKTSTGHTRGAAPLHTLKTYWKLTQPRPALAVLSVLLAVLTAVFGIALTSLSGWLIVRAAEQPAMMYLTLAVVGVRFFGIGRATWRYNERLITHRLVLDNAVTVRAKTWVALSTRALSVRSLLRGEEILDRLISDVDELRDAAPRVLLPTLTQVLVVALALLATVTITPQAWWVIALAGMLSTLLVPWLVIRADARAESAARDSSSGLLRLGLSSLIAAPEVKANALAHSVQKAVTTLEEQATTQAHRGALASGLGQGLNSLIWWSASLAVLALIWQPVQTGEVRAPMAAIIILMCTAMLETSNAQAEALRGWQGFAQLVDRLNETGAAEESVASMPEQTVSTTAQTPSVLPTSAPLTLEITDAQARWQGMETAVFSGVTARVGSGQWLGITGPSGAGKTTALATLLGFLPLDAGEIRLNGVHMSANDLRGYAAWCPQEAHTFESTLAGNLSLARDKSHAPSEEEMVDALRRVGLGDFYAQLTDGLRTRVGAGGSYLSGGQRQRLAIARTLLVNSPLLLLDEPTAHLDAPTAHRLMDEAYTGTHDRNNSPAVVVVSHRAEDINRCDRVVQL